MREKGSDYSRTAAARSTSSEAYAQLDPNEYGTFGPDCWGFSAGDGPAVWPLRVANVNVRFFEYVARGVPFGPDDGTIAPQQRSHRCRLLRRSRCPPCVTFSSCTRSGRHLATAERLQSQRAGADSRGWISEGYFGLDQGVVVLMIENYRSGLIWKLMRNSRPIRTGLKRAGFTGGWL
jgi:hypothetical protein